MADYEPWTFDQVPETGGIPKSVFTIAIIGVIAVFTIGGACIVNAPWNHLWPAAQTQRAPLSEK